MITDLLDAALDYCARGLAIFPVEPRGKRPICEHGVKDATTDAEQIRRWWEQTPDANIGLATGAVNGIAVVDVDGEDGAVSLRAIAEAHPIPETLTSDTARGVHLVYRRPDGEVCRNRAHVRPGIDLRGDDGYIVAPPSVHATGHVYAWRDQYADPARMNGLADVLWSIPVTTSPPPPPTRASSSVPTAVESYVRAVVGKLASAPVGRRNDTLNGCAYSLGRLVGAGQLDEDAAAEELRHVCHGLSTAGAPMTVGEVERTIRSALEAGKQDPRALEASRPKLRAVPSPARGSNLAHATEPEPEKEPEPKEDLRPCIVVTVEQHLVNDAAVEALAKEDGLYQRSGQLCRVVAGAPAPGIVRSSDTPSIRPVDASGLSEALSRVARWKKFAAGGGMHPCRPPEWSPKQILARGEWRGIRRLTGWTSVPQLRPDGSILVAPGYDDATGLLLLGGLDLDIPDQPTREHAMAAFETLCNAAVDYPFADPAHRSAYVAAVLTGVARYAYEGPSPLFLVDANVRGAGKSLLAGVVGVIITGRRGLAVMQNTNDDAEMRKRLTAIMLAGDPVILLDNVAGELGTPSLDSALTSTEWVDRELGTNRQVRGELRPLWMATANNAQLRGDTTRRVCHIRIEVMDENPEERAGFVHAHLLAHVHDHRAEYVSAALTILRAYHVAGRPDTGIPSWGSYEGWSGIVRAALVWAGAEDPAATRKALEATADSDGRTLRQLLDALATADPQRRGMTVAQMMAYADHGSDEARAMKDVLDDLGGVAKNPKQRIGMKIRHMARRVAGMRYLDMVGGDSKSKRSSSWAVFEVGAENGGTRGTRGTNSHTPWETIMVDGVGNSPQSPPSPPRIRLLGASNRHGWSLRS